MKSIAISMTLFFKFKTDSLHLKSFNLQLVYNWSVKRTFILGSDLHFIMIRLGKYEELLNFIILLHLDSKAPNAAFTVCANDGFTS